jgi:3-mercaptopyruvate sulfurtransferase SseA
LELGRDIYIYGETDEETATAAAQLRAAGYRNVSELRGGVAAWKAVGFPVESLLFSRFQINKNLPPLNPNSWLLTPNLTSMFKDVKDIFVVQQI